MNVTCQPGSRVSLAAVFAILAIVGLCQSVGRAQPSPEPAGDEPPQSAAKLWTAHIQPLLVENCQKCHGGAKAEGGLDLRTLESILQGGEHGPAVVPGAPQQSLLLNVTQPGAEMVMPPESAGLSADERGLLERWISTLASDAADSSAAWNTESSPAAPQPDLPPAGMPPTVVIDYLLAAGWHENQWVASSSCDDRTFVRRLYLDLIGRIPTHDEVDQFLTGTSSSKREQLIDQLLASPEYAEHFATLFDTMLMGRSGQRAWRERSQHGWHDFLKRSFAENRPWSDTLREIVLARPQSPEDRGATWFLYERQDKYQEIAEAVAPALFGVQIQCAQCHDHPIAPEIKQAHYWGLVAFFSRGKNQMTPQGPRIAESAVGAYEQFTDISGNSYPNLLTFIDVPPLDDSRPESPDAEEDTPGKYRDPQGVAGKTEGLPRIPQFSRREVFADQVLADHPRVATAMVNRLWALLMGRGLVHPVDKIDSVHPSEHPALLAWLARDFREHGYDIRRTVRAIVLSHAYQLNTTQVDPTTPPGSFSYAIEKPLTAEVLIRSLAVGLYGVPESERISLRRQLVGVFPDVLPEESVTTLKQTLYLSNNPEFNACFRPQEGSLTRELVAMTDDEQAVQRLFQQLVNRAASVEEVNVSLAFLQSRPDRREDAITHLVWALATSAEFRFNH